MPTGVYETNNDNGTVSAAAWTACTTFHSFLASSLASLHPSVIVISSNFELQLADPPHLATPAEVAVDMTSFLKTLPATSTKVVLGGFPQPAPTAEPDPLSFEGAETDQLLQLRAVLTNCCGERSIRVCCEGGGGSVH